MYLSFKILALNSTIFLMNPFKDFKDTFTIDQYESMTFIVYKLELTRKA